LPLSRPQQFSKMNFLVLVFENGSNNHCRMKSRL
jgi:hypothetical protein